MNTKTKKTATKPAAKTTKKTVAAKPTKKLVNSKKAKIAIIIALIIAGLISVFAISKDYIFGSQIMQTQINTPVISRTELNKKEKIEITLFDEKSKTQAVEKTESEQAVLAEQDTKTTQSDEPKQELSAKNLDSSINLSAVVKNITDLELAQVKLQEELKSLTKIDNTKQIDLLTQKVAKLESLNGNIGNLSKIFLAQQLVLLDNAFKVGGNQNLAIENIYNFAKNVAKDDKVALKLQDLLTLTTKQAIITPQALLFYAQKLENIKLIKLEKTSVDMSDESTSFIDKVKKLFKSFIIVRKTNEVSAEKQEWLNAISNLQEAIIFTDFLEVEKILKDEKIRALGSTDIENFEKLFNTYLKQQLALQATLGSFIEGYKYDY